MTAPVLVVGCGPGPADLLTVRAAKAIGQADLVLHDHLVSAEVLALARPGARRLCVGKRAGQAPGPSAAEIGWLAARAAHSGEEVARLHGGDASIFGRLAVELAVLRSARVPFEVVPGVTSALAAAATLGVPLTERDVASSVTLAAGTNAATVATAARRGSDTLAFYMARERVGAIARELIESGIPATTPAALVLSIGAPEQLQLLGVLEELLHVAPPASAGPGILLVGHVLRHAFQEVSQWRSTCST